MFITNNNLKWDRKPRDDPPKWKDYRLVSLVFIL